MNMLLSLLSNKYVLTLVAILSFAIYVKNLHSTIETMRDVNRDQVLQIDAAIKENYKLREERDAVLQSMQQLTDRKITIVRDSQKRQCTLDGMSKATEGKEKVDEKDVLGSKLPESIVNSLRM